MSRSIVVEGKRWIPSLQRWSWIITIVWMTIANIWKPFGLFGFVCMFTPIIIALQSCQPPIKSTELNGPVDQLLIYPTSRTAEAPASPEVPWHNRNDLYR